MYSNIPLELRALKQWVCWREGKVPYQLNGQLANVTDPATWNTFEACVAALSNPLNLGIGFVFTDNDPYSFIDLDNTHGNIALRDAQVKISEEFKSYSEVSPSGMGLHIIVKGKVPKAVKRSDAKVEIYSSGRYATMTGQVYKDEPINECQEILTQLWARYGGIAPEAQFIPIGSAEEVASDDAVISMASSAANNEKFLKLHNGQWKGDYPSQSEADQAYVNILQFYTQSIPQLDRMFRKSKLMRSKVNTNKSYLPNMIKNAFDRTVPQVNIEGMKAALDVKLTKTSKVVDKVEPAIANTPIPIPPGLLGEIAQFIYQAAPRPVPEVAIAAAIGLMAGITGRAYNFSGTGLNQYVLVLAKTGRGKEAAASGIDKLMNSVKSQAPTSPRFRGPGIINSGQALTKYINTTSNCFVSVLGEFGITIERISNPYANSADKMLYQNLLDLYNKSGHGQTFQPSIYSKKEDNVGLTPSPVVTILGESTHKLFYGSLNEDMISAGLLPRFLIIEYNGDRVDLNEEHINAQPSWELQGKLSTLIAQCETIMSQNRVIIVQADDCAKKMLKDFDNSATATINASGDNGVIDELWNRAHMKVFRLSAMMAVGVNWLEPVITCEYVKWAIDLVQKDIQMLSSKFNAGEIGKNSLELKQEAEIIRIVKEYVEKDFNYVAKYSANPKLHADKIVSHTYLSQRLTKMAAFRSDRVGETVALKRSIQNLIDNGKLIVATGSKFAEKYGTTQKAYIVHSSVLD